MYDAHITYNTDVLEDLGWKCCQCKAFMLIKVNTQNNILIMCLICSS